MKIIISVWLSADVVDKLYQCLIDIFEDGFA